MVVESQLDLAYVGMFLGLRVNEIVRERGARAGFRGLRDSHGYVVQHLIDAERTITELAQRMEVSQQAASKSVAELVKHGILESRPHEDGRARTIRLSKRGWAAIRFARRTRKSVDAKFRRLVGRKRYDDAKAVLIECLKSVGGMGRVRSRKVHPPK
jgi:DNA-binding MarR family transcriptional regulator